MKLLLAALLALTLTSCAHAGSAASFSARSSVSASFSRPTYVAPRVTYTAPAPARIAAPVAPVVRPVAPVVPVVRAPVVVAPVIRPMTPRVYVRPMGVSYWHNWYLWNYLYNRPVVAQGDYGAPVVVVHRHAGLTILAGIIALLIIFAAVGVILRRD